MFNIIVCVISHLPANHNLYIKCLRTLDDNLSVQETVVQYMKDLFVHVDSNDFYQSKVAFTSNLGKGVVATCSEINSTENMKCWKA